MKEKLPNNFSIQVGNRLRNLRERGQTDKKMSQATFSEKLDIESRKLSRLETGEQLISSDLLVLLSEITGKSMEYIMTGKEVIRIDTDEQRENFKEKEMRILFESFYNNIIKILKK